MNKWVVIYSYGASPIGIAEIIFEVHNAYEVKYENGDTGYKYKQFCKVCDSKEEARKIYDDYTSNKNNYAYEG